jgi:protoheme IX farnesyltransferase
MSISAENTINSESLSTPAEAEIKDYIALLKPRVMSLVIFTGICGALIAPGNIHPILGFIGILALAVGAGAAGAFNMWYDRDIDALMRRTESRPIPAGRMIPSEALTFAITLSMLSVLLMGLASNWVAAGLLAFANIFYSVIYTMLLKRSTVQNIVIGGAAGAFPPMIGWAMVTGDIDLTSTALFMIIFFWTPPHFWALSLFACRDYKKANVPMMPCVKGERHTKHNILFYTLLMWPVCFLPLFTGHASLIYAASAVIMNIGFTYWAVKVWKSAEEDYKDAKKMFAYSILYLFVLFLALVLDRFIII